MRKPWHTLGSFSFAATCKASLKRWFSTCGLLSSWSQAVFQKQNFNCPCIYIYIPKLNLSNNHVLETFHQTKSCRSTVLTCTNDHFFSSKSPNSLIPCLPAGIQASHPSTQMRHKAIPRLIRHLRFKNGDISFRSKFSIQNPILPSLIDINLRYFNLDHWNPPCLNAIVQGIQFADQAIIGLGQNGRLNTYRRIYYLVVAFCSIFTWPKQQMEPRTGSCRLQLASFSIFTNNLWNVYFWGLVFSAHTLDFSSNGPQSASTTWQNWSIIKVSKCHGPNMLSESILNKETHDSQFGNTKTIRPTLWPKCLKTNPALDSLMPL